MNIELLKKLGNIEQIAGIRESTVIGGKGEGTRIAEYHNAAGLRFTVLPDRGMDIYDLSYKGINLSFLSKNGIVAQNRFSPLNGEFSNQWSGGAMVTCGLDNVGGHSENDPTHGRSGYVPASGFGKQEYWDGNEYILSSNGEMHLSKMFGRHLSIRREISTTLYGKSITVHDVITNFEDADEPYMILYHCNFGYPLLDANSKFVCNAGKKTPLCNVPDNSENMSLPIDGQGEELYLYTENRKTAFGLLRNDELGIAVYVKFNTDNLPNFLQWKRMKSQDYVLAIEPCNTCGSNRADAIKNGTIAVLPAYSSIENTVEIGVLEGEEINNFIKNNQ